MAYFSRNKSIVAAGLLSLLFIVSNTNNVHAATPAQFIFEKPSATVGVDDEFSVDVKLALPANTTINTLAGDIVFSDSNLKLERVTTANSIVTSWIESPLMSGNSVTFSGIMPGGYNGVIEPVTNSVRNGSVFTLVFKAVSSGSASLAFSDSHLYLNDGEGTEIPVTASVFTFSIATHGSGLAVDINDTVLPEAFTPVIAASPDVFNGANAVYFQTKDTGTGIDHYEISEGSGDWVVATSPYRLSDQTLHSRVRVKAVDVAGNYIIEEIAAKPGFRKSLFLIPAAVLILIVIIFLVLRKLLLKKKRAIVFQNEK
jgi:hypothetical protein